MGIRKPNKITRIFDGIIDLCVAFAAVLVLLITLGIASDVTLRFFFNRPIWWMIEVVEYALLWITFLLAAWVLRREKHVKMDIVLKRLKPTVQSLVNIITSVLSAIAFLVLTWFAAAITWESFKMGYVDYAALKPPLAPIQVIIPIGSFLLFILLLRRAHGYWKSWRLARVEEPSCHRADEELQVTHKLQR